MKLILRNQVHTGLQPACTWYKNQCIYCSIYRNLSTDAVRNAKFVFEGNLSSQAKINSNLFWKYVRSCTKVKSNVGILECNDGSTTETDYEIAKCLEYIFKPGASRPQAGACLVS